MKVGSGAKHRAYSGFRDGDMRGRDRVVYHLFHNRQLVLHWRIARDVECGEEISNSYRHDTAVNRGRGTAEERWNRDVGYLSGEGSRYNSNTRCRTDHTEQGRN